MNAKRLSVIVLVLAGLSLLVIASRFAPFRESTYEGKPVSVWFKEYVYASNAPAARVSLRTGSLPGGRTVLFRIDSAGRVVTQAPTNRTAQIAWLQPQMSPPPDPAGEALQAFGSEAVPHLVKHLRVGTLDRTYERAITNLPPIIQRKLPSPSQRKWLRLRAIDALINLREKAHAACPALLELLKQSDPSLRYQVIRALRSAGVERGAINKVMLNLGAQGRYADVIGIARQAGWDGEDMARLLAEMLRMPDPALRRDAMWLLEHSGTDAAPAMGQIIVALRDSDAEVRYLATRAVEASKTNTPRVVESLRASLADGNVMVRNVARRILLRIAPDAIPADTTGDAGQN